MRVIVTRPQAQAEPLLTCVARAEASSRRVPGDRDRADRRRSDRRHRVRVGDRHERERRRRTCGRAIPGSPRAWPPSGSGTAAALEAQGIAVELRSHSGVAGRAPRRAPRAGRDERSSSAPRARDAARRRAAGGLPRGLSHRRARRRRLPDGDLVLLASPSAARAWAKLGASRRRSRSGRRRRPPRSTQARASSAEAKHAERRGPRRLSRGVARFITFLTDFGLQDDFVGTCHGVMKRIAPEVEIIDITHGIPPQGVLQGALTLANTLPFMPEGVHLAVVDPGVGGARRAARAPRRRGPRLRRA